ncbi:3-deoxy-7-phosphoheptulonate synthase [bacterium]|nr:3-deoxy-7-phosphoheptulonate synthase [bacterium]
MEKRKLENNINIDSWKNFEILQQPEWPNNTEYRNIIKKLSVSPSLILYHEIIDLKKRLQKIESGKAFLLQGGDCAETFKDFSENNIKKKLEILFQMSTIISYGASIDIIKIGRMAGQYAKPRTLKLEERKGISLPSYRGDSINEIGFTEKARTPNPLNLIKAYNQSLATLNLLKSLINNKFKNLDYFSLWDKKIFNNPSIYNRFENTIKTISKSLKFLNVLGEDVNLFKQKRFNEFYVSHEGLILDYETAFTKNINNDYYNSSTHMLWLGDRTRNINSAHVEYLSNIINPIGVKCGASLDIDDLEVIIKKINPLNEQGKIMLICRFGEKFIAKKMPQLINMVIKNKFNVIWMCDPMHGNTYQSKTDYKTRNFKTIINELNLFFEITSSHSIYAGGVHFEFTPNDVTECLGGIRNIQESDLHLKYETACDPRLNHEQSIELAFTVADLIKKNKKDY